MNTAERVAFLAAEARRLDPERFATAVLAPPPAREAILALLVLNQELARAGDGRGEPVGGLIRFQWWRDALAEAGAGRPRAQPLLEALAVPLADSRLSVDFLEPMIDCRERALEGARPDDMTALETYLGDGSGRLQESIARVLGVGEPELGHRARSAGVAFAMVSLARAAERNEAPALALLPRAAPDARHAITAIVDRAQALIAEVRRLGPHPRVLVPALLPLRLAAIAARRPRRTGAEGPGPEPAPRSMWTAPALAIAALTRRP